MNWITYQLVLLAFCFILLLFGAAGYFIALRKGRDISTAVLWAGLCSSFPPTILWLTFFTRTHNPQRIGFVGILLVTIANLLSLFPFLMIIVITFKAMEYVENMDPLDCNGISATFHAYESSNAYTRIQNTRVEDIKDFTLVSKDSNRAQCKAVAVLSNGKQASVQYTLTRVENSHFPRVSVEVKE